MERYVCIHGHFYQPPRESPWLDMVEVQDSAYPYHDWNERIAAECYGPNAVARILGPDGRIVRLVNNYSKISFNFGPTLLAWLEEKAPDVYQAILDADREGRQRFGGHGPALAQVFNHPIMPLCNPADKVTQVRWGVRDFIRRFGRAPEGMWLAETAVDLQTLEVLAAQGIRFTILAPHQAGRIRPLNPEEGNGDSEWQDVTGAKIDPSRAYVQNLPSGRSIALFFYDGPVSRAVAFEGLLNDAGRFAARLKSAFDDSRTAAQLVHIATDGESYGHHARHGDMALAAALAQLKADPEVKLTCYGQFLALHPPAWEVDIIENTAWSCAHGIERWRSDCGCNSGRPGWRQAWRGPLRHALDLLRDAIAPLFEAEAGELFTDPWAARDAFIDIVLERTPEAQEAFLEAHARGRLGPAERVRALELMELQRNALLMYTSCGWFFDEISGIETVQVLLYAGRVIQLGEKLFSRSLEGPFLKALARAPSNLEEHGDARTVYERYVRPAKAGPEHMGAHYAVSSLFEDYPRSSRLFCYQIERHDERRSQAGKLRMVVGHATLTSLQTTATWEFAYAAIHFGDHNVAGGVARYPGPEQYLEQAEAFTEAFARVDMVQLVRLVERHFGESTHSLASLFKDEQRKVLRECLRTGLAEPMQLYQRIYEQTQPLMRFLRHLAVPLPVPMRAAAEVLFDTDLRWGADEEGLNFEQVRQLVRDAREWGASLDQGALHYRYSRLLARAAERWRDEPASLERLKELLSGVEVARELPFAPDLWRPQNLYVDLARSCYPRERERSQAGDPAARQWCESFLLLGERLGIDLRAPAPEREGPPRRTVAVGEPGA